MDDSKPNFVFPHQSIPAADPSDPPRTELPSGNAVVFCGSEAEVSRGFVLALAAMGLAGVDARTAPAMPPAARAKP
jgi:hypothetical protein